MAKDPTRGHVRWIRGIAVSALSCVLVSGCGGAATAGGDTTCAEWVALTPSVEDAMERVRNGDSNLSEEQEAILTDALDEKDFATDDLNVVRAANKILTFCGPDGTGMRPNIDAAIAGALS